MKKTLIVLLFSLFVTMLYSRPSFAEDHPLKDLKNEIKQDRQQIKDDRKDLRKDFQDVKKTIIDKIKDIKSDNGAKIANATVTAKTDSTLTITKDAKTYTVNVDAQTKFIRHFWGKSSLAEITIGNQISVFGKFTDDSKSTIQASLIRDLSIMKRLGAFLGKIITKNTDNFVLQSGNRGNQTVYINANTKVENRTGGTMTYEEINVGDKIRVKGMWDKSNNTVTETTNIKDFSNPAQVAATPTP